MFYEGGIRVPFLLRWPGRIPAGTFSDEPVISIDVSSTALSAAGIKADSSRPLDSKDLLPVVAGALEGRLHEALFWAWIDKDSARGWAVRKGTWKLLVDRGDMELYDLEAGLSESRDLAASRSEIVENLHASYRGWRDELEPRIQRRR